jgi:PAS domain S-box-containing protein/diguanylate cyclase (GGDEF)-like protein
MKFKTSTLNLINTLFTAIVFTTVIGYFLIVDIQKEFDNSKKIIKEYDIAMKKKAIKYEVDRAIEKLTINRMYTYKSKKMMLKRKLDHFATMFDSIVINDKINIDMASNLFEIDNINSDHYFFIFDKNEKIKHFTKESNLVDTIVKDSSLDDTTKQLVKKAIENGYANSQEIFPTKDQIKSNKKTLYITKIENHDYYIGVGIYINELELQTQNKILNVLSGDRFGQSRDGYFWVFNTNGTIIAEPENPLMVGQSMINLKDPSGKNIYKEFLNILNNGNGYGYLDCKDYKNDTLDSKSTYIREIKDWNLVLATSFYHKDIAEQISKKQDFLENLINKDISKVFTMLLILFITTIIVAYYISRKIGKLEEEQEEHLAMLENYKHALDESSIVTITDKLGVIKYVNNSFCKVSGYTKEELIGNTHKMVRHDSTPKDTFKNMWETISLGKVWKGIIRNRSKNGKSYYHSGTILPLTDKNGDIIEYMAISFNVTELFENREKLENIFLTDRLTSLGSRFKLLQELEDSNSDDNLIALIDIDRFREINNTYGNQFGDTLIKDIANTIFALIEKDEYKLYRIHADVFCVLTHDKSISQFIEKIKKLISDVTSDNYTLEGKEFSINFTTSFAKGDSNVLAYADTALKNAKRHKKVFEVYSHDLELTKEYEDNIYWVNVLNQAFKDDLIFPFYQPIYNYHTGKIEKYETLVRMITNGEIISPINFLEVAKKTKLYSKITTTMVEKVINKFKNLNYEFSINLSVDDLLNSETMDLIYTLAKKENIFKRMVIEIVESEELQSFDEVHTILKRFKDAGSKIAIDDFGSGYSTFDYLIYLNADYIKIDASIVKLIESDERAKEIVSSITAFAKKSNMKTIAEYVSSSEIDHIVKELGVDYAQGYYYGKPQEDIV